MQKRIIRIMIGKLFIEKHVSFHEKRNCILVSVNWNPPISRDRVGSHLERGCTQVFQSILDYPWFQLTM